MKNRIKALAAFVLVLILFATELTPLTMIESASAVTQAEINALEKEASKLASQKTKVEKELKTLKSEKSTLLKRKTLLDQQIALLDAEIGNAEEQITQYETLIVQTQQELYETQLQEEEQGVLFRARVRAMEERGNISYWSVLFGSQSFAELLGAFDFISEVMEADQRVIDGLRVLQQEISQKQTDLENALVSQEKAKASLAEKVSTLETQRISSTALIQEMMANESEYQAQLKEIEAEEERTQEEIVRLSRELAAKQGNTKETYGCYIWPVTTSKKVSSKFGPRNTGIKGASTNHKGIDIAGVYYNSTVYAAKSGTVIVSTYNSVRGNYVTISHGSGNTTLYQHLSKRSVSVGDVVKQGDPIGVTGSSGVGSGPHLHFEITENGKMIDPLIYLKDYRT